MFETESEMDEKQKSAKMLSACSTHGIPWEQYKVLKNKQSYTLSFYKASVCTSFLLLAYHQYLIGKMLHNTNVTLYTRHLSHIDQQGYLGLGLETNLYQHACFTN